MHEYTVSMSIDGFVFPWTRVLVDREVLTIRPALLIRWLVWSREVAAADTASVSYVLSGIRLEKTNGTTYDFRGGQVDALMAALASAGFPMGVPRSTR